MIYTSEAIETAVESLSSLPTIGRKTAQRLALHLLRQPKEDVEKLAHALLAMKEKVRYCSECCNLTESDPCAICASPKRNRSLICVVEEPNDLFAIERTREYFGLYHVLHGSLNPLEGVGPNDIKMKELLVRMGAREESDEVEEIILAMNPNVEGEVTTQYSTWSNSSNRSASRSRALRAVSRWAAIWNLPTKPLFPALCKGAWKPKGWADFPEKKEGQKLHIHFAQKQDCVLFLTL